MLCVSVPLSGLLFLNEKTIKNKFDAIGVSVPLSGLLFLNGDREKERITWCDVFPSPFRGYYF